MQNSYEPDKTWGIVICCLSALGLCFGGLIVATGGFIGFLGANAVNTGQVHDPTGNMAIAAATGILVVLGVIVMLSNVLQLVGGALIMKSRRSGFWIAGVCAVISFLSSLGTFQPQALIHLAISGVTAYYCWARLFGKIGPSVLN